MTTEREILTQIVMDFMATLGLAATYSVKPEKNQKWVIRFTEFDGSYGQQLLFNTHLAVTLSKPECPIHPSRVRVGWLEGEL